MIINTLLPFNGFGDFLRGTYFFMQMCEKLGIPYGVNMSKHIFMKFLKHRQSPIPNLNIKWFNDHNSIQPNQPNTVNYQESPTVLPNFLKYCRSAPRYNGGIYIYTNSHPIHKITPANKAKMQQFIEPSEEMQKYVDDTMVSLGLEKKQFSVLHIRTGDKQITNNVPNTRLIAYLNRLNIGKCVLLTDDKSLLTTKFITLKNPKKHSAYNMTDEDAKNTLLEFYLMANASRIVSLSCYGHGSGFSQMCAYTYDIPYKCFIIQNVIK